MNTAAVAALEARVKLYMKNYEGAITAAQEAITLSGGTIVSTKKTIRICTRHWLFRQKTFSL